MARPKSRKTLFVEAMQAADPRYKPHGRGDLKAAFYTRLDSMPESEFSAYVADNAAFLGRMYARFLDMVDDFNAERVYHNSSAYRNQTVAPVYWNSHGFDKGRELGVWSMHTAPPIVGTAWTDQDQEVAETV